MYNEDYAFKTATNVVQRATSETICKQVTY